MMIALDKEETQRLMIGSLTILKLDLSNRRDKMSENLRGNHLWQFFIMLT